MIQILQLFVRLCLFQGQAHDVPRSEVLLFIAGLAAIISNSVNAIPNMGVFSGILISIGQVLLFAVLISLILKVRGMGERSIQALTGMFGATTLLQLIALPFFSWHEKLLPDDPNIEMALTTPLIITAGIAIWSLAVMTSILRQTMETKNGVAFLLIIGCQSAVMFVIMNLSGNASG